MVKVEERAWEVERLRRVMRIMGKSEEMSGRGVVYLQVDWRV